MSHKKHTVTRIFPGWKLYWEEHFDLTSTAIPSVTIARKREPEHKPCSPSIENGVLHLRDVEITIKGKKNQREITTKGMYSPTTVLNCTDQETQDILDLYQKPLPQYSLWQTKDRQSTVLVIQDFFNDSSNDLTWTVIPSLRNLVYPSRSARDVRYMLQGHHRIYGKIIIRDYSDRKGLESPSLWMSPKGVFCLVRLMTRSISLPYHPSVQWSSVFLQQQALKSQQYSNCAHTLVNLAQHNFRRVKGMLTITHEG